MDASVIGYSLAVVGAGAVVYLIVKGARRKPKAPDVPELKETPNREGKNV